MKIIRGALSAADVSNPNIRYDATCDCLQQSPDGGTTWNDAPGLDPRHATGFLKPPVAGSSKQCDAAANMVKWLHDFIDEMLFDFELVGTVTTIINSIVFELEILAPYIELLAIISELAETISAIGGTALAAAFTSDQYDLLLCIFFCNADADGRISAAKLIDVESDITAQLNTTAAVVTNAILFVQGEIGLSNAGSVGSETGDCSGCACGWCWEDDLTTVEGSFMASVGSYSSGWIQGFVNGAGCSTDATYTYLDMARTLPAGTYTKISFTIELTKGTICETNTNSMHDAPTGGTVLESVTANIQPDGTHDFTWTGSMVDPAGIHLVWVCGEQPGTSTPGGTILVTKVHYEGTGDNPFGADNC